MKPNFSKPTPVSMPAHEDVDEESARVTETQINADTTGNFDFSEDEGSEYASDASHSKKKASVKSNPKVNEASTSQAKESTVKKAARKIKATAHANFRRLKIKSKVGNGGKGRFGRRK